MKRPPHPLATLLAALAWLPTLAALFLPAATLKGWVDARAGGASYHFTLELCGVLRSGLLTAGPAATLGLWLWRRLGRERRAAASGSAGRSEGSSRGRFALVQAVWVLGLCATGLARLAADPPVTKDTKFYLSESLAIAEAGGLAALPGRCFAGEYVADNRHLLYPGALSLVAEESDRFSDRARLLSLAGAALALVLASSWMRRVWGEAGGLLGGTLLLTNGAFLEQSRLVACESWMMALAVPWFFLVGREGDASRTRSLALAGVSTGLLWLTKGTGTLYLAATLVALLADRRAGFWRPLGAYLAGFTLVSLPLLWRNAAVYGNPLHNINSSKVFWLDSWQQFFDPAAMQAAGPRHYFATHDLADVLARAAMGSFKVGLSLLEVLSPFEPALGLGLPLLAVALVCAARDGSRRRRWLWFTLFALFLASFSWYAKVVASARFLAALLPVLLAPVAVLGPTLFVSAPWRRALWAGAAAAGAGLVALGLAGGAGAWRPGRFTPAAETAAVHAFLLEQVGSREDVHYLLGPSDHFTFDWDADIRGTRWSFPRTEAAFDALLAGHDGPKLRYALVAAPDPPRAPGIERAWARVAEDGTLAVDRPPPGWRVLRRIPAERPRVIVFERQAGAAPPR